ncbi:MAG: hypothetical protein U0S48_01000 [Solirubrobacteraceae bacterium]
MIVLALQFGMTSWPVHAADRDGVDPSRRVWRQSQCPVRAMRVMRHPVRLWVTASRLAGVGDGVERKMSMTPRRRGRRHGPAMAFGAAADSSGACFTVEEHVKHAFPPPARSSPA